MSISYFEEINFEKKNSKRVLYVFVPHPNTVPLERRNKQKVPPQESLETGGRIEMSKGDATDVWEIQNWEKLFPPIAKTLPLSIYGKITFFKKRKSL